LSGKGDRKKQKTDRRRPWSERDGGIRHAAIQVVVTPVPRSKGRREEGRERCRKRTTVVKKKKKPGEGSLCSLDHHAGRKSANALD